MVCLSGLQLITFLFSVSLAFRESKGNIIEKESCLPKYKVEVMDHNRTARMNMTTKKSEGVYHVSSTGDESVFAIGVRPDPPGIHWVNVSYFVQDPSNPELTSLVEKKVKLTKLTCYKSFSRPYRLNATHSKVECGIIVANYSGEIKWWKDRMEIRYLRNKGEFVFPHDDRKIDGTYKCSQNFTNPPLYRTVQDFVIKSPAKVFNFELRCEINPAVYGANSQKCNNPSLYIIPDTSEDLRTVETVEIRYRGRNGQEIFAQAPYDFYSARKYLPLQNTTSLEMPGILSVVVVNSFGLKSPEMAKVYLQPRNFYSAP